MTSLYSISYSIGLGLGLGHQRLYFDLGPKKGRLVLISVCNNNNNLRLMMVKTKHTEYTTYNSLPRRAAMTRTHKTVTQGSSNSQV